MMKAMTVGDLDAMAREAVKAGALSSLSMDIRFGGKCHISSGVIATRIYEGDVIMFTCATCNAFVGNLKVSKE